MKCRSLWKKVSLVFLLCASMTIAALGQTFKTLDNFDGPNGALPFFMSLVQGTGGKLYGTTYDGGASGATCYTGEGCGTVFEITRGGNLSTLYEFFCQNFGCSDGLFLYSGLIVATDGNFYGTTEAGGANDGGTVFKITPGGQFTTLYRFCAREVALAHGFKKENCIDGAGPWAPLVQTVDGSLYGSTTSGGTYGGGTIFKISTSGVLSTVYNFSCAPGCNCGPGFAALVQGQDGDLYGAAGCNAGSPDGSIFRITPKGRFTTLYTFCSQPNCADGVGPRALLLANDGSFYGTTGGGGADNYCDYYDNGCGTVFKMTSTGELTTLYSFCSQPNCTDGALPFAGLIQATDGALYGTTSEGGNPGDPVCEADYMGCGTIFKITLAGSLTTLYSFDSMADGWQPIGGLLQATNGNFYGTTEYGGNLSCYGGIGCGTVFGLDMGLGPFVAFIQAAAKIGKVAEILGQGFEGATGVSFNGTPANFTIVSDTYIRATVPQGATTGYVTVTTPTGVLTSNVPFQVIQ